MFLLRERFQSGIEDFDVHFSSGGRGASLGQPHFGLHKFTFQSGKLLVVDEGMSRPRGMGWTVGEGGVLGSVIHVIDRRGRQWMVSEHCNRSAMWRNAMNSAAMIEDCSSAPLPETWDGTCRKREQPMSRSPNVLSCWRTRLRATR